jgi:hypothetical protein
MFAKLYETEVGQILVKMDSNEEYAPEVRFYFEPQGLGVCSLATSFKDNAEGWDNQEKYFNEMSKEQATSIVKATLKTINI